MTDQDILAAFDPAFKRFSNMERLTQNPPLLAHYTSITVMEQILQSGRIWFSNPLFMNDLQEMRFGLFEGANLFADEKVLAKASGGSDHRAVLLQHAFTHFLNKFDSEGAFDTYIFCLSEHDRNDNDGVLSMWRAYGQYGNGAALVFDPGKITMVETSPLIVSKVTYASDDERRTQLRAILDEWAGLCLAAKILDDKLYLASLVAVGLIKTYALTTKHKGFQEENEWRVIYYPERDAAGALKESLSYHIGARGVEPKLKFRVGHIANVSAADLALERMIDRIILGPSLSTPLARRSVERLLEGIGKESFKERLRTSTIPLRPSSGSSV